MVEVSSRYAKGLKFAAKPDVMSEVEAEVFARAVARFEREDAATRLLAERAADARAGQDFLDFFEVADARQWDPHTLWSKATAQSRLRAPLGKNPTSGKTVWLDLKEDKESGMGPHGMLTGQIGSGKSETLVSLILALTMTHSPEVLQLILGDFKGETAMMALADLPHVQGVVSNLEESESRLDRLQDMLNGEVVRRETILKKAGYKDVRNYERARATTRPELEPLGTLLIVIDEFSELLKIRPTVVETFDRIALKGRGLWMHILNASQRVETGRMGGMIAQQTYSIGMKVKDAGQSRQAIGSPKAYTDLVGAPVGTGFLVFEGEHHLFRSFYVSAPFIPPVVGKAQRRRQEGQFIDAHPFEAQVHSLPIDIELLDDEDDRAAQEQAQKEALAQTDIDSPTVVSTVVGRLAEAGRTCRPMHRMHLPPLEDIATIPLDTMAQEFWGRDWLDVTADAGLRVPYGRADDPFAHTQDLLVADLAGAKGNVMVVGAPQSGKSTAVQAVVASLAISHSPQRVQFYGIDFGGGKVASLAGLPHVAGVAGQGSAEKIARVVSEVERLLKDRVRNWELAGIDLDEFRARKFAGKPGEFPDDGHGDVFLIVDNLGGLKEQDFELHARIVAMGTGSALNYGVHLLVTNDQWMTANVTLKDKFGTRIELRVQSATDSEAGDRDKAKKVPEQPGRGLTSSRGKVLHFLTGVPAASVVLGSGVGSADYGQDVVQQTCALIAQRWSALGVAPAPTLPTLPAEVGYAELGDVPRGVLKLGVGEQALETVGVNLAECPHFYTAGSAQSGRTTVLKTLIASIQQSFTPEDAQIIAFDVGLELEAFIDPAYLAFYSSDAQQIGAAAKKLAAKFAERTPPADANREERARWRFSGPRYFIVIDDFTLLNVPGYSSMSLVAPLEPVIARGRQIGVHLLVASAIKNWMSSTGGNKIISGMSAAGAGVLILDGERSDGPIVDGIRAVPRAPGRGELIYPKGGRQVIQVATAPLPEGYSPIADGDAW